MATCCYSTVDVLLLLDGDNSDFVGSEWSGEEVDKVCPYSGPSFQV